MSGAQDWLQGLKENVIIGRLIPARVEIPGMEELLKPQPMPEIEAISPGGWLGSSNADENSLTESLNLDSDEREPDLGFPELLSEDSENEETPDEAPESELVEEDDDDPDINLVESGDLNIDGANQAIGEEDAEGSDEPDTATESEGD